MPAEEDVARMRHMLDAARAVQRFTGGRRAQDLASDEMLAFAVVRGLEIIGEAASQVSDAGQKACPELPWALIVGMRHRLVHAYFEVNLDRVWDTVVNDLPLLAAALERILSPPEQDESGIPS